MISKKIAASTVALALGASAVVAPQATALPEEFTSPPGRTANPQQGACAVVLDQNITTVNPGVALKTTQNGVSVGVGLDEVDNAFVPWVSVSADSERVFQSGTAFIVVENVGTQDATHSYKLEALKKGSVGIKRKGNEPVEVLDVNEVALIDQESFSLKRDQKRTAVVKLAVDSNQQAQTWAWRVNNPTILAAEKTRVSPTVQIEVAPWVFETDDCAPIVASEQQSQAIIADGNEYDTGITVANAENDYQRLTGNVSIAGKKIEGAKVRVDDTGKVYVTLPKGATGSVDDDKAAKVDVEIIANPRETTKDEDFDAYKNPQVLRVATEDGVVDQDTPKFTGSVPVAKFAPAYNTPNTVKPGGSVDVALKAQPGDVRGTAVDATYTVVDAPEGWTAEPAKDGTLKVTAPKGAKHGDTATFTVDVTYADGSKDTIDTVVTVRDTDANLNTPGYGETYGKVGVDVSLEQNNKNLPEGSTFTITPGQDLGDWVPKVDPTTGTITVTIPGSAKPGDVKTILVDVTYPDGSVDKNVPAKVIVHGAPEYPEVEKTPGQNATLKPKKDDVPGGSTYEITPGQDLEEWNPQIDAKTGDITVTVPKTAKDGDEKIINVTVTYPSGKTDVVPAKVTVKVPETQPGNGTDNTTPGDNNTTTVIVVYPGQKTEVPPPNGSGEWKIPDNPKIPEGWKVEVNPSTGNLTITPPADVKPGTNITIPVEVKTPDGKTTIVEIPVKTDNGSIPNDPGQKQPQNLVSDQGSSENIKKCFDSMSSENNPLLWLVPLGLLIAIGAPLAGPLGAELGKAAANVSEKMNIPNPLEQFGLGGETNRRPQPEWMRQIQVEADRLQQQFGPEVTQAAAIGLSLAGLAAGIGILAALCKDGELPEWAQSSKSDAKGSSDKGEDKGEDKSDGKETEETA